MPETIDPVRPGPGRPRLNPVVEAPKVEAPRNVEVRLNRGYVPRDSVPDDGVYTKVEAGTIVSLPVDEAADLCEAGIATPTRNAFR